MLARLRTAGLLWPTVLTLVGLAVMIALGTWQMQRKAWKDELVQRIAARVKADPATLDAILGLYTGSHAEGAAREIEYRRLKVTGRFLHDREQYLYAPHPKLGTGFDVLTPLEVTGRSPQVILVNRGYVPESHKDRATRAAGLPAGETTLTGLVRLSGEKGGFTPANEPAKNAWYWRDIPSLAKAAMPGRETSVLPFMLDAEAEPAIPGGWPKGGTTIVKLPNRHLEYALTWYGLAATLAGVYLAFAWGRLRAPREARTV